MLFLFFLGRLLGREYVTVDNAKANAAHKHRNDLIEQDYYYDDYDIELEKSRPKEPHYNEYDFKEEYQDQEEDELGKIPTTHTKSFQTMLLIWSKLYLWALYVHFYL